MPPKANRAREREQIADALHAEEVPGRVRIRDPAAPTDRPWRWPLVRTLEIQHLGVVPGLRIVRRVNEVAETVRTEIKVDAAATRRGIETEIRPIQCQEVLALH